MANMCFLLGAVTILYSTTGGSTEEWNHLSMSGLYTYNLVMFVATYTIPSHTATEVAQNFIGRLAHCCHVHNSLYLYIAYSNWIYTVAIHIDTIYTVAIHIDTIYTVAIQIDTIYTVAIHIDTFGYKLPSITVLQNFSEIFVVFTEKIVMCK